MSRSGYTDDCDDNWAHIRWRGAVASALRGNRGQAFLRELAAAMDAMPVKELIADEFVADGQFCALAIVGQTRGLDMSRLHGDSCPSDVAKLFGIPHTMAAEIMYENDDVVDTYAFKDIEVCGPMQPGYPHWGGHRRTVRVPETDVNAKRWRHMRAWIDRQLAKQRTNT